MHIKFTYRQGTQLSKDQSDFIFIESKKFGSVETKTYSFGSGAIDLISIINITLTSIVLSNLQAFTKGFFGEDWFKNLGEKTRQDLEAELRHRKAFIKAYFDIFVRNKENKNEAYVISEVIGDVTLYVVINHYNMTEELIRRLPQALVDTYGKISLGYVNVESKICQLFPDFESNEWRYLFAPTYKGFGNFIDQYFDFKTNKMIRINSKSEFLSNFNLVEEDMHKFIINAFIGR
jgi:hypothetical protein